MAGRRICVVTGTRAEYGLLRWVMEEIQADEDLVLQVLATGMHLSPEFGLTYREIEEDGFTISENVEMLLSSDSSVGVAKSIGLGTIGFADAFARLRPDLVVVLGDRFEILAAVQAAMVARLPIAHLYGGESTEGVIDEPIRHAVTKMSHFHFVTTDAYRRRVIQLGEDPENVFNFGAPGLDSLERLNLLTADELIDALDFELRNPTFLVTYHPVTLDRGSPGERFGEVLAALEDFPDARIVFTKTNADTEGRVINRMIDAFVAENRSCAAAFVSLGQQKYLSVLRHVDLVVGNSSSGLLEAPYLRTPTVNVGPRQRGRLRVNSVLDCKEERDAIRRAIQEALTDEFRERLDDIQTPYGGAGASKKIKEALKSVSLDGVLMKKFHDLDNGGA